MIESIAVVIVRNNSFQLQFYPLHNKLLVYLLVLKKVVLKRVLVNIFDLLQ